MRWVWVVCSVLMIVITAQAQDEAACRILVWSEEQDSSHLTLYTTDGRVVDDQALPVSAIEGIALSFLSTQSIDLAMSQVAEPETIHLYQASWDGFQAPVTLPPAPRIAEPRPNGWSHDNRYLALHNIFDNDNERLFIYDTQTGTFAEPPDLFKIYDVTWSPTQDLAAFYAYDILYIGGNYPRELTDFAVHVVGPNGIDVLKIPVESYQRLNWLSGNELAVVSCPETGCKTTIYDVANKIGTSIGIGQAIVEAELPALDRLLITQLPNRNLFLLEAGAKRRTSLTNVDFIYSRPTLSADQRYVAFDAKEDDSFWLYVIDLLHPESKHIVALPGDAAAWDDMYIPSRFETYWTAGAWNPYENTLLYGDANAVYLLDADTGDIETVIEATPGIELGAPRWVCR